VRAGEREQVREVLPERAVLLFEGMSRQDQRHGLDVLYGLREQGVDAREVLAAALLHDVAKSEGVRTWHRIVAVLVRALSPELLEQMASPDPGSWRHPFWLQLRHAERGAELAEAAGCASTTVQLIRHHEHEETVALPPPLAGWLAQLRAIDSRA
jgi:hypothetical protein